MVNKFPFLPTLFCVKITGPPGICLRIIIATTRNTGERNISPINDTDLSKICFLPAGGDAVEENANNDESSNPSESIVNTPEITPVATQTTNNAPSVVSNDVEVEALKVIRGEYGIGQERKNRLGNKYDAIQQRVNELKRKGAF